MASITETCYVCTERPATSLLHPPVEHRVCRICHDTLFRMDPRCPVCRAAISARVISPEEIAQETRSADRLCMRLMGGLSLACCTLPALTATVAGAIAERNDLDGSWAPLALLGGASLVSACIGTGFYRMATRLEDEAQPAPPPQDLEMGEQTQ